METHKNTRQWHVGEDDVGRPILLWDADSRAAAEASRGERDAPAQAFDCLKRLDVPSLTLEAEIVDNSRDPYDNDG